MFSDLPLAERLRMGEFLHAIYTQRDEALADAEEYRKAADLWKARAEEYKAQLEESDQIRKGQAEELRAYRGSLAPLDADQAETVLMDRVETGGKL